MSGGAVLRGCARVLTQQSTAWRIPYRLTAPALSTTLRLAPRRSYTRDPKRRQDVQAFHSQMDDPLASSFLSALKTPSKVPQTLTEKIVQAHATGLPNNKFVKSGDYVTLQPAKCMTHDNSWPVALKFMSIGASRIRDPGQIVMTLDHDVQNKSDTNMKKYRQIEDFAKNQGVDFYPAGRGIGHQIMVEEGYAWPGTLAVASDSHSNMYGGVGCLGTPVVRTDAASIWATGKTWWQIPPIAKVTLVGTLPTGVSGKDVIVALCGLFKSDEVLNHAIEFVGSPETMRSLTVDDRLTIANMTTEWGALSGLFPIDSVLQGWLRAQATEAAIYGDATSSTTSGGTASRFNHHRLDSLFASPLTADPGAMYAKELFLDLSTLTPHVSGPNSVKVATPLRELEAQDIRVDRAYLVSCTNSRRSDIAAAADIFRSAARARTGTPPPPPPAGPHATDAERAAAEVDLSAVPKIPAHVNFYIAAASLPEQRAAEEQGDWQVLLAAGAQPLPAGCGPCIGLGAGLLQPGEVGISASNRNFKGRMGSTEARAYLASPAVVAASALAGRICGSPPSHDSAAAAAAEVRRGEGDGKPVEERMISIEGALEKLVREAEAAVDAGARSLGSSTPATPSAPPPPPASAASPASETAGGAGAVVPGFPRLLAGEIVFLPADNVNTDAIYPGKYTYSDALTPAQMAAVVMENYDPSFAAAARPGDVLVAGANFGCGSSREQAATAVLASGARLVVAASLGNVFARNAVNNALLAVELPGLVDLLRGRFPAPGGGAGGKGGKLTHRTGWRLEWDVPARRVTVTEPGVAGGKGKVHGWKVGDMPPNVQEIVARGGLEGWVRAEIGDAAEGKGR